MVPTCYIMLSDSCQARRVQKNARRKLLWPLHKIHYVTAYNKIGDFNNVTKKHNAFYVAGGGAYSSQYVLVYMYITAYYISRWGVLLYCTNFPLPGST